MVTAEEYFAARVPLEGVLIQGGLARGAIEYNTARTAVEASGGNPLRAAVERLEAVLRGAWVAADERCTPGKGEHISGCRHTRPIPYDATEIARLLYPTASGRDGGHRRIIRRLMFERAGTVVSFALPEGVWVVDSLGGASGTASGRGAFWFSPAIHKLMMSGRYQGFPVGLVSLQYNQFRLWREVLAHPQTSRLAVGRSAEYAVGAGKTIDLARLGLAGTQAPSRIRKALETEAAAGNGVQNEWHLSIVDAKGGGMKARMRRLARPVTLVHADVTAAHADVTAAHADVTTTLAPRHESGLTDSSPDGNLDGSSDLRDRFLGSVKRAGEAGISDDNVRWLCMGAGEDAEGTLFHSPDELAARGDAHQLVRGIALIYAEIDKEARKSETQRRWALLPSEKREGIVARHRAGHVVNVAEVGAVRIDADGTVNAEGW
jgi:hypothetical protein